MSPFSLQFTFYLEDKFLGGVKDFTSLESKTNKFPHFLMFILYWSIIDLECFVSFRCTVINIHKSILFQIIFPFRLC